MGKEDGQPKTPEWASPICGVPSRQIKALAHQWAKQRTSVAHGNGGSFIRSTYSHEPARFEVALMTMMGLGKPGRNVVKFIEWYMYGLPSQQPAPCYSSNMTVGAAYRGWDFVQTKSSITKTLVPEAILGNYDDDHPLTWQGYTVAGWPREDQFNTYRYPIEGAQGIHMIWTDTPCWTTCWNGGNKMIEALRSERLECVVAQQPWMENDCLFADILLPINTKYEEEDIGQDNGAAPFGLIYHEEQAVPARGESKSDWEAVGEVARKLGLYDAYVEGKDVQAWIKTGFEGAEKPEDVPYEDFLEKGYYIAPTRDDWEELPRGFELFCNDPEGHPLSTPTGLVEFYATGLAEHFPDDDERPPVPHYIPFGKRHQESLQCDRAKDYPYLLVSNHPRWRIHANMDDISWLRRDSPTCKVTGPDGYKYEPLWINRADAKGLGLESGDIAKPLQRPWLGSGRRHRDRAHPSWRGLSGPWRAARSHRARRFRPRRGEQPHRPDEDDVRERARRSRNVAAFWSASKGSTCSCWRSSTRRRSDVPTIAHNGVKMLQPDSGGMRMKAFVVDLGKLNGCYACQLACKDETVGNEWPPYSKPQPDTGQFWLKMFEKTHGQVPKVRVEYRPQLCRHCGNAPCMDAAPDAVYRREDGLVIIDPAKAAGHSELVDACPYGAIYWNDDLGLPQKCTGCAHLVDAGYLYTAGWTAG